MNHQTYEKMEDKKMMDDSHLMVKSEINDS